MSDSQEVMTEQEAALAALKRADDKIIELHGKLAEERERRKSAEEVIDLMAGYSSHYYFADKAKRHRLKYPDKT